MVHNLVANILHFTFGILEGPTGGTGGPGEQGVPGEVTAADLGNAIHGTSQDTIAVATLGQTADSSYNPAQRQDVLNKLDESINAARRP